LVPFALQTSPRSPTVVCEIRPTHLMSIGACRTSRLVPVTVETEDLALC
jgi:hypothetical protein